MHCGYFDAGLCRSCSLIETPYSQQLAEKERTCRELLGAHTDLSWLPSIASEQTAFRNKAKLAVGGDADHPTLGILDRDKQGVDLRECAIVETGIRQCVPTISSFITRARLTPYDVAKRHGELKYVLITQARSGELSVRFVLRSREALSRIRKHLPWLQQELPRLTVVSVNLQPVHTAVIEGEREIVLTQQRHLTMTVGRLDLRLGARSFFQTNTAVADHMYRQANAWARELSPGRVWDLYCGVGGFALSCAEHSQQVLGIEASEDAIDCARSSSAAAGVVNVRFIAQDAHQFAAESSPTDQPDLAVVNPPRRGLGGLASWLEESGIPSVIYSSCNARTLATDLESMPSFTARQARMLDMFPQTSHSETMVLLTR